MKKPKKLYRYDLNQRLRTHVCGPKCVPQIVSQDFVGTTLWRCRHEGIGGDHYGYPLRKEAVREEIETTKGHIMRLQEHLQKLQRPEPLPKTTEPVLTAQQLVAIFPLESQVRCRSTGFIYTVQFFTPRGEVFVRRKLRNGRSVGSVRRPDQLEKVQEKEGV